MSPRAYRQSARAASVAATRSAILDAVDRLFLPDPSAELTLDDVAAEAGTTVQTVLRHYGSKAGLLAAAAQRGLAATQAGRDRVPAGDLEAIARYLAHHYEEVGPMIMRLLAADSSAPEVADMNAAGRDMHLAWVERVLAPLLDGLRGPERRRRLALLVAATDLLTWRVLRLEQGLSQADYQRCVRELLERLR